MNSRAKIGAGRHFVNDWPAAVHRMLEVVEDDSGSTYRGVYTVKFAGWVYVLHCFQKKSKSGIKTPKEDMDLIRARLKAAKADFEAWIAKQGLR